MVDRLQALRAAQVALWLDGDPGWPFGTEGSSEPVRLRCAGGVRLAPPAPRAPRAEDRVERLGATRLREAGSAYLRLVVSNVRAAARRLRQSHERSSGQEGLVEFGCTPDVATDAAAIVAQAVWLRRRGQAPNVIIGVPASDAGVAALHELTYRGINAAVDGVFCAERYEQAAEAYLSGLERRLVERRSLSRIASLAWIPVAVVDGHVDAVLQADSPLRGAVGVATAQQLHLQASRRFAGARWRRLAGRGAEPQRLGFRALTPNGADAHDMSHVERLTLTGSVLALTSVALDAGCAGARLLPVEADETEIAWVLAEAAAAGARLPAIAAELERATHTRAAHAYGEALEAISDRRASGGVPPRGRLTQACC